MLRCKSCKRVFQYSEGRELARASNAGLTEEVIENELPEVEIAEEAETGGFNLASLIVLVTLILLTALAIGLIALAELSK